MAPVSGATDYRDVRPAAPLRALISGTEDRDRSPSEVASILDLPHVAWFANGRSAIAQAAMLAGVGPGSSVLVPMYHCESMVSPLAWLGARIIPYGIREDLSIDPEHLASVADAQTRLILVPQYFGHWRQTTSIAELAGRSGWAIVEDCAHAFLAIGAPAALGANSDFMVASAPKFFAAFDGGVLASRIEAKRWPRPKRPPLGAELRALVEASEYAFDYGRWPWLARAARPALGLLRRLARRGGASRGDEAPTSSGARYGGIDFEPAFVDTGATLLARTLARHAGRSSIAAARRRNWLELRSRIGAARNVRFPIDGLGPMDVPYVLAIEIPDPDRSFPALKARGVPVYRWETSFPGCDESVCPVSRRYRRSLIQIPCHQSLSAGERDWIARTVLSIVGAEAK